jgi:hypothetical protein
MSSLGQRGLYTIDLTTGEPTVAIAGVPGSNGYGSYNDMTGGADGKLYVLGSDGTAGGNWLFRLDGSTLVPVANVDGNWLAMGPAGRFLVAWTGTAPGGHIQGKLWLVDPMSGVSTLVAQTTPGFQQPDVSFGGVAYDASRQFVYVIEGSQLYAISLDPAVPALNETWGSVKALYRR